MGEQKLPEGPLDYAGADRWCAVLSWPGKSVGYMCIMSRDKLIDPATRRKTVRVWDEVETRSIVQMINLAGKWDYEFGLDFLAQTDPSNVSAQEQLKFFNNRSEFNPYFHKKLALMPAPYSDDLVRGYAHWSQTLVDAAQRARKTIAFGTGSIVSMRITEAGLNGVQGGSLYDTPSFAAVGAGLLMINRDPPDQKRLARFRQVDIGEVVL